MTNEQSEKLKNKIYNMAIRICQRYEGGYATENELKILPSLALIVLSGGSDGNGANTY